MYANWGIDNSGLRCRKSPRHFCPIEKKKKSFRLGEICISYYKTKTIRHKQRTVAQMYKVMITAKQKPV